MAQVTLAHVAKRFDGQEIIHDLNLTVNDGEFMVLVGPSGCGKTTTLRMVAGLEEATHGTIKIGDRVVNDIHPKDRDIAMVFQNYALYPHMTVFDNMAFGLKMRKVSKAEIQVKVQEAAEMLDLARVLDKKPNQLSGGQRQRVALGRAIVRHPQVFLMDEPLSNLDAKFRVQMRSEIRRLHNRLKTTTIYVTHDQIEAMTMGDRISVFHQGRIQQTGAPLEVYHYPKNIFVGAFIGAMSFLRAISDGDEILLTGGFRWNMPMKGEKGQGLLIGIRPEHFSMVPTSSSDPVIEVVPEAIELLGAEQIIHFHFAEQKLTAIIPADLNVLIGRLLQLFVRLEKVSIFDEISEQNIYYAEEGRTRENIVAH